MRSHPRYVQLYAFTEFKFTACCPVSTEDAYSNVNILCHIAYIYDLGGHVIYLPGVCFYFELKPRCGNNVIQLQPSFNTAKDNEATPFEIEKFAQNHCQGRVSFTFFCAIEMVDATPMAYVCGFLCSIQKGIPIQQFNGALLWDSVTFYFL